IAVSFPIEDQLGNGVLFKSVCQRILAMWTLAMTACSLCQSSFQQIQDSGHCDDDEEQQPAENESPPTSVNETPEDSLQRSVDETWIRLDSGSFNEIYDREKAC